MRLATAFLAAMLLVAPAAFAQAYDPPRTPEGRPDFTGVWSNAWLTPLEKLPQLPALTVPPEQAKMVVAAARMIAKQVGNAANDPEAADPDAHSLSVVRGEHRTRQIVEPADGMLPYGPEGLKRLQAHQARFFVNLIGKADDPEDRLSWERCLAGMGQAPLTYAWSINGNRRFVQTKDALVIHSEAGGDTRIVHIGGRTGPVFPSHMGASVGRWDGDTLVVETTGFRADDTFRNFITGRALIVTPEAKVVERFTRVGEGEITYSFTVEDPATYDRPWLAEYAMVKATQPMFEFACHEGNYGLANILKGQREIERRRAQR